MTINASVIEHILGETDHILSGSKTREQKLQSVSQLLQDLVPHYDWVGFYLVSDSGNELELGPYTGASTDHTLIPFGKGICGQVAEAKRTFVIQDVNAEDNYLSCSIDVQSEIVVPILKEDRIVADLDIDSHTLAPFQDQDTTLLDQICQRLVRLF